MTYNEKVYEMDRTSRDYDGKVYAIGQRVGLVSDSDGCIFMRGVITQFYLQTGVTVRGEGWEIDTWLHKVA